jgi:hypothetical protein
MARIGDIARITTDDSKQLDRIAHGRGIAADGTYEPWEKELLTLGAEMRHEDAVHRLTHGPQVFIAQIRTAH